MEFSHDDAGLAGQPIGYWSWAAHQSVIAHIRGGLARHGLAQPQWWVLNQVLESGEEGRGREELVRFLGGYLDVGETLHEEIDGLVAEGRVTQDAMGRLYVTPAGEKLRAEAMVTQRASRETIHDGIPDEEYVRALKVLQRMIHNTDGKAWHH